MTKCAPAPARDDQILARQLAALAHPVRLTILRALACSERSCCKDVVDRLPLAQSTVSQHLKVLAEAGLVKVDRRRPHSHYRLDREALAGLCMRLSDFSGECLSPADTISVPDLKETPFV
ncbi:MAG: ArsR family transcriptional regulator [Oricola sp.]|jgi:DNA-binding transcriptional ArsR family regulator|nr:MAG: ArsR family transcriptional regulator [Oricola sp.]